ncbi:hypothetical protein CsSME_00019603 [Camellia sinensis var. sinensis]
MQKGGFISLGLSSWVTMFHYYMLQFYYFLVVCNYGPPPSIDNSIKVGAVLSIGQLVP